MTVQGVQNRNQIALQFFCLLLAAPSLCCFAQALSNCSEPLLAPASLAVELGL